MNEEVFTLEDFEPEELTRDVLDKLCSQTLGLSLRDVMKLSVLFKELQTVLNNVIHPDRMSALIKATTKPDPIDCAYVKRCVIDLLRHEGEFSRFRELVRMSHERLG